MSNLPPREKLKTALAISRGIEFFENYVPDKISHTGALQGRNLAQLYFNIHQQLFQDTLGDSLDTIEKGGSGRIKDTINDHASKLFDNNGFFLPIKKEELTTVLPKRLAETFKEISAIKAFPEGNEITTRLFFAVLGKSDAFKNAYGNRTIDFRNLDKDDIKALRDPNASIKALTTLFAHATDPTRTPMMPNTEGFKSWQDNSTTIEGLRFLQVHKGGKDYLVTANGGLVARGDIEPELKQHLASNGTLVGDFRVKRNQVKGYLVSDLEHKSMVDGIDVKDSVPLICMDTNSLTGLSDKNHARLIGFLRKQGKAGDVLFQLAEESISTPILNAARDADKNDLGIHHIVEVAVDRIHHLRNLIDEKKEALFIEKNSTHSTGLTPQLFISMGGSATGKSSVEDMAKTQTGGDYVEASLDKARDAFDTYRILRATGHHADDYAAVEDMARTLRQWTADKAIGDGYNLLYDGSGIPYTGSYSTLANKAAARKYKVSVSAADCMLVIPPHRSEECEGDAVKRAIDRAETEKRAVPWNVTIAKHIGFIGSLLDALEDRNVDKIMLDDRAGPKGHAYIMGESFEVDVPTVTRLKEAKKSGKLLEELRKDDGHLLPHTPDDRRGNIPELHEANVDFLHKVVDGKHRIFVINNVERFIDLAQKGHMNSHAAGKDNLTFLHNNLAFHVPDMDTPNGDGTPHEEGHLRLNKPTSAHKTSYVARYNRGKSTPPSTPEI